MHIRCCLAQDVTRTVPRYRTRGISCACVGEKGESFIVVAIAVVGYLFLVISTVIINLLLYWIVLSGSFYLGVRNPETGQSLPTGAKKINY